MNRPVAITAFALWNPAGVCINRAPALAPAATDIGGLAPWPSAPSLRVAHPTARRPSSQAAALVQLAHALWATRATHDERAGEAVGLVLGTAAGSRVEDESFQDGVRSRGPGFGSPGTFVYTLSSAAAGEVSLALGARGGLTTLSAGAVSGWAALLQGAARVARGQCEACLAGAMELHGPAQEGAADFIGLCLLEPLPEPGGAPLAEAALNPRQVSGQLGFHPGQANAPPGQGAAADWARLGQAVFSAGTTELSSISPEGHWVQLRLC